MTMAAPLRSTAGYKAFYGGLINPETLIGYSAHPRALVVVGVDGTIDLLEKDVDGIENVKKILKDRYDGASSVDLHELEEGDFIMPGFIDTHTHAPQVLNLGRGQQYELLDWLEHVTFPMESRFSDVDFAKRIYPSVVRRYINSGTTTCCYYGSLHLDSTKVLSDVVKELGQRALIGKCNMNRNSPDHYREPSSESSITDTKALISYIRSIDSGRGLVHPVITPRFAISCTSDLLHGLGSLSKEDSSLAIQTHISENKGEIAFTKELFPECSSYAHVYDVHGLLSHRTILAHGVHLEDDELELIKSRNAGVSHCPTSNFNLRSGMARVGYMLDRGIKIGLGTDVSGGFSPSMLTVIQHASICSKMVAVHTPSKLDSSIEPVFANKQLPIPTLLYLATMGGAQLCNLDHMTGNFALGKSFDALLVSTRLEAGNPGVVEPGDHIHPPGTDDEERLHEHLERFLFCGDDRNILRVFVQGKCIGGSLFATDKEPVSISS